MALGKEYVERRVDALLSSLKKANIPLIPPVDIDAVAKIAGIRLEYRSMIPEGVLCTDELGFRICLQNNFAGMSGANRRQRFTFAHEVVHTFFYDTTSGPPAKQLKGSPRPAVLESLCHHGAGLLLVPDEALGRSVSPVGVSGVDDLVALANAFEVSDEVMMKAIHRLGACRTNHALLMVEETQTDARIKAAFHDNWIVFHAAVPKVGSDYNAWVQPLLTKRRDDGDAWVSTTNGGEVSWKRRQRTSRSFFIEIKPGQANEERGRAR
jgi:hypothetical protein